MKLNLLECQIEVIMKSLELYCYIYRYTYAQKGKKEERDISLYTDTYESIFEQFSTQRRDKRLKNEKNFKNLENIFEKFS